MIAIWGKSLYDATERRELPLTPQALDCCAGGTYRGFARAWRLEPQAWLCTAAGGHDKKRAKKLAERGKRGGQAK